MLAKRPSAKSGNKVLLLEAGGKRVNADSATPRRGTGRRRRRGRQPALAKVPRLAPRAVANPFPPLQILSDDQVESIHGASLIVLRDHGLKVLDASTRERLRHAGAGIDDKAMVRFDPDMVMEYMAKTSGAFDLRARNPAHNAHMGGNRINFTPVQGPSFVSCLNRGRRAGTYAEMCDFLRLVHCLGIVNIGTASPFEPLDLPAHTRHLDKYYAAITCHDKLWNISLLGGFRARDGLAMVRIAHGLEADAALPAPAAFGNINTNSPRQLDANMSDGLTVLAQAGQPVVVTPFTLLGAMAPTTLAGALVQQNAEALGVIVLTQVIRAGTPVIYGGFTSNVDMKSGAPAFGTPEYFKCTVAGAQLARRYGLPFRASNTNAANAVDAQAAYESQMSLWACVMGHTNLINHGAGWLEGGLTGSFEKLIIDAEMLQMMAELLEPIATDAEQLAVEAIAAVPPGGHFFGADHTLARYKDAFYTPLVSDWRNFESWSEAGCPTTAEQANRVWQALLKEYEPPPLDPALNEALQAYMAKRKEEITKGIDTERDGH